MNFTRLAATAKRLIDLNGRAVSFVKLERDPVNTDKPWRADPAPRDTGQPEATLVVQGCFVEPSSLVYYGFSQEQVDGLRRPEQTILVSGPSVGGSDLENFDEIVDTDGSRWNMTSIIRLEPSSVVLLYVVGVRR